MCTRRDASGERHAVGPAAGPAKRRVVITGVGAVSPFGVSVSALMDGLHAQRPVFTPLAAEERIQNVDVSLAGRVPAIEGLKRIPRELRRTMSPMGVYALLAAREALACAGLGTQDASVWGRGYGDTLPRTAVCIGSTMGSGKELHAIFAELIPRQSMDQVRTTAFFKIMPHTAASALVMGLGLTGRLLSPSSACAAGLQGLGLAYEAVAFGRERYVLAGGTEEYVPLTSATFDKIGAASHAADAALASLPFDGRRDGIVCAEGAGVLVLEDLEYAQERGAVILAEVLGFATLASPTGVAFPDGETTLACMQEAIADAGLEPGDIRYVSAHATATTAGDIAESRAIAGLFGDRVPVASPKGVLGHTLAASGALETVACTEMLRTGRLIGCRRDMQPDPACNGIQLAVEDGDWTPGPVIKNSFALGGVYASLVLGPYAKPCPEEGIHE